ncbi:MAG: hypothetical protein ABS87_00915 [Sphingomonas sp. SCN 67-18]|nr:helix-turn-helix transcriptional regulator [Sphingomonas sp. SCN 67-18]ODU22759.1 MAG: hypothetical protein ABS87_00915 [Sphingomonas sp. SCN 67-18]
MGNKPSVQDSPIVSHDRTTTVIKRQLHIAVNVERRFTVQQIADESGVSKDTIASYMRNDGPKEPSLSRALSIAVVLGKPSVRAIMALIGYSACPLDEPEALRPMQIVANGMQHFAVIARCAADNRIDHTEEKITTDAADALIATVLPLSSAGRAA